ncbi:Protein of unknown function DUF1376 [uncultured Caudovirales phage]|uniref:DUF1376 domain-containing protein n=1 Tax=uncultured Caudovirales phage TaxID=2100421 RepID=A0A6J5PC94_9CAUD|nr:Protein of unknown function DUF1376 [uncultured Caudovirales phage]CAB4196211.1 Protein of unknown function DUF1376 [uncultured Caudovirales phage]CAB4222301.1 Protein of unknown function DUF1376 [uncultured Caudovirales phage]
MSAARPDTWMPIYWGDYAKDTGHLGAVHHGAYMMLIKHYWVTGEPLVNDDAQLWRIACADSLAHWKKLKPIVLAFFQLRDGRLHHGRIEQELENAGRNANRRADTARRAAEARWGKRGGGDGGSSNGDAGGNAPSNAPGMRPASALSSTERHLSSDGGDDQSKTRIGTEDGPSPSQTIENQRVGDTADMPDACSKHSPSMLEAMHGECSPPSPSPKTIVVTTEDHSLFEGPPTPDSEPIVDHLAIPEFLRRPGTLTAELIAPDWLPSQSAQDKLAQSRPDLTSEIVQRRMQEFRNWCAERNTRTHNADATWFSFMVKTHVQSGNRFSSDGRSVSAGLAGLAEAGSR